MGSNRSCSTLRSVASLVLLTFLVAIISCESGKSGKSPSKTNSPPVIVSVTILPEKPTVESELSLSVQSKDPEGDPITYQYQWIKNDEEVAGENQASLKRGSFRKGDLIRVRVTASDGKVTGTPVLSSPVKIHNTPPVIQEVSIEPKVAYAADNLKAIVKCSDPEGDFIYYTYQWEKNGSVLSDERMETLEKGKFKKGDSIVVIVTPDDREALGTPKRSEPLLISNSPPQIVSSPPNSVEKTTYIYQVKANEPDNDPITFTLKSGPRGMEIDKKSGLIRWEIRKEDKGTYPVEIEVSDSEGAKSNQRYTLTIDFK
jgi:hypothetical protein